MTPGIIEWVEMQLGLGFLVFLRVGGMIGLAPGFGEQVLPARVRLLVALAFTVLVIPLAPVAEIDRLKTSHFLFACAIEVLVGLILGIGLRAFVFALQVAGSIAAQATSLAQLAGSSMTEPAPAMGQVLVLAGLTFAMIMRLPEHLVVYVITSYDVIPAGQFPTAAVIVEWGVNELAGAFTLGFQLAAPFVAISLLYNLTLGIINRAMPQLMVVFVGAPAITAGSLILLSLLASVMIMVWWQAFEVFFLSPFAGRP